MLQKFHTFYSTQDKVTFYALLTSTLSIVSIPLFLVINYPSLPKQLPLFYSLPWGESYLVSLPQFATLPFVMVLITLVNLLLSWHLHHSQIVLKRLLNLMATIVNILLVITSFKIIYIFI